MTLKLSKPILYLITRGATTEFTTPESPEFQSILPQVSAAVSAGIPLIQIREKQLTVRTLFELVTAVAEIARRSSTRILVNDRADVAAAAGADGVHLTRNSLAPDAVRKMFGPKFLIGCSTHSMAEARCAQSQGADFAVFGPVFYTASKEHDGPPVGLEPLREAALALSAFPLIALGGVSIENARECLLAGASGLAGITMFGETNNFSLMVETTKALFGTIQPGAAR